MISQVLFTSEQPKKNKMAFVGILSHKKLLFGPLVIQLVWETIIHLSVGESGEYPPLFTSFSVNNLNNPYICKDSARSCHQDSFFLELLKFHDEHTELFHACCPQSIAKTIYF